MGTEKKENLEEMFDRLNRYFGRRGCFTGGGVWVVRSGNEADPEMQPDDQ